MLVYHYCSMEAFKSIIENKTLRLTDITKSNDSAEIRLITDYIKEILLNESRKKEEEILKKGYPKDALRIVIEGLHNACFNDESGRYGFYVVCFSEDGDLLSQWRGYAVDASGISIGFDSAPLDKLGKNGTFRFDKVDYETKTQKAFVQEKCGEMIQNLKEMIKSGSTAIINLKGDAFTEIYLDICQASPFFKLPFFKEEKEYRLALWAKKKSVSIVAKTLKNGFSLSELKYEIKNGILRPYADLSFANYKGSLVKEVIIGPKCKSSVSDVKRFLSINDMENVKVKESAGTYR